MEPTPWAVRPFRRATRVATLRPRRDERAPPPCACRGGRVKAAIVHDWLIGYAGSERVLEQLLVLLPDAALYALIDRMGEDERAFLGGRPVRTSLLDRVPGVGRFHRAMLPLMPFAVEQ